MSHLNILNISNFKRNFFTAHGQHLNKFGKQVLSRIIADIALNLKLSKRLAEVGTKISLKFTEDGRQCSNSEVSFAHCISADFDNQKKYLSQGVATVFRDKFGRPSKEDYCFSNLTYQKTGKGAGVDSLVTKRNYFENANNLTEYKNNYDLAFSQLAEDFKARNLQTLICSTMGCNRDHVSPVHFVSNLLRFQTLTGAAIFIITGKSEPHKYLKNGLKQTTFFKYLKQIIVDEYFNSYARQKSQFDSFRGVNAETTTCGTDRRGQEHLGSSIQSKLLTPPTHNTCPAAESTDRPSLPVPSIG